MALYDYGIGGNEVRVDANESIAEIPSNRTLLVQKLTDDAPSEPECVYGLQTHRKMCLNALSQPYNWSMWMQKETK